MSESMDRTTLPIFWSSETHRGLIRCLAGTTADGKVCDLGIWVSTTEKKTGREESTVPYNSIERTVARLAEKYSGFHVVSEPDAVAAFEGQEV
jgi:hypothetical protein